MFMFSDMLLILYQLSQQYHSNDIKFLILIYCHMCAHGYHFGVAPPSFTYVCTYVYVNNDLIRSTHMCLWLATIWLLILCA